jgi:hypothetical protein
MAHPAIAERRLSVDSDGLVVHALKLPLRDGTTHVLFEPRDLVACLAARVPRIVDVVDVVEFAVPGHGRNEWLLARSHSFFNLNTRSIAVVVPICELCAYSRCAIRRHSIGHCESIEASLPT